MRRFGSAAVLPLLLLPRPSLSALPAFSWTTVPLFFHSCNFSGPFSAAAVAFVASHASIASVTVEKGQALDSGDGRFAEARILDALRAFKAARPALAAVAYFNSVLDWPYYALHADMAQHPEFSLKNESGLPVLLHGDGAFPQPAQGMEVFGFGNDAAMRAWYAAASCGAMAAAGGVDGCFEDRAGPEGFPGLKNTSAYDAGHVLVLAAMQDALPQGFIVANNFLPPLSPGPGGVRATMIEFFRADAASVELLAALAARGVLVQAHSYGPCDDSAGFDSTLAAFLIGAGENSFFACSSGWKVDPAWPAAPTDSLQWHAAYDEPLGAPCGPFAKAGDIYSRSFGEACGTRVLLNATSGVGTIEWRAPVTLDVARDCGCVGDNATVNTARLNACAARAAPGDSLLVPRGVFLTGTVSLGAGTTLRFADGGWLQGSANASDYSVDWDFWHVVQAVHAPGVRIVADSRGGGGIVGAMWQMIAAYDPENDFYTPVSWAGVGGCVGECRPKNLAVIDSDGAELRDFALRDSSDWTTLLRRSSNVLVDGLIIRGSQAWGNNDGIDVESGTNITLSNLDIATGDDCIAMRSGNCNTMRTPWAKPLPPLAGVRMLNLTLSSSSSAIKVENLFQEDHGDVLDVSADGVRIYSSNRGVGVWQRVAGPSGGRMANLSFANLDIETRYVDSPNWWGSGEALVVTSVPEDAAQMATGLPGIHGVTFANVVARAEGGCLFSSRGQAATSPRALEGLVLRNVSLTVARVGSFLHNQLDFRPVDGGGGAPNTVPALVAGLVFEGVFSASVEGGSSVAFEGPPQPFWAGAGGVGVCVSGNASVAADFACRTA